ncbi:MAG: winged helix-turn-helix transcriptional regulator [Thermodesulfobacteria bacterium]|nr:winged helix-turn-helix transcriptional regulator [Thermodesulfobacteriota bacterium]
MIKASINKISRRLKAISDPTRIKILILLSIRPACVCELTQALGLAQPTISRHLRQLEDEGFVRGQREKNWIIYHLSPMEECCTQLLGIVLGRAMEDPEAEEIKRRFMEADRAGMTSGRLEPGAVR